MSRILIFTIFLVLVLASGCVKQSDYDKMKSDYNEVTMKHNELEVSYEKLTTKYEALETDYNNLETAFNNLDKDEQKLVEANSLARTHLDSAKQKFEGYSHLNDYKESRGKDSAVRDQTLIKMNEIGVDIQGNIQLMDICLSVREIGEAYSSRTWWDCSDNYIDMIGVLEVAIEADVESARSALS